MKKIWLLGSYIFSLTLWGVEIPGPWEVAVRGKHFMVPPPELVSVKQEAYESLPPYQKQGGWNDGIRLYQLAAVDCSLPWALVPDSVQVETVDGTRLKRGVDYQFNDEWGTIGRLEGGKFGPSTPVWISYAYTPWRIDSIIMAPDGSLRYAIGNPASYLPQAPTLLHGEVRLANIFLDAQTSRLTSGNVLVVTENSYPEEDVSAQLTYLPHTLEKLCNGKKVTIVAWGDSVTRGDYLPGQERWQNQFLARLRRAFPAADIQLITCGWPGQTSPGYMDAPPEHPLNYQRTVLNSGADLVISEFVNDTLLPPDDIKAAYTKIRDDFQKHGMEWIIITPHYTKPEQVASFVQAEPEFDKDPRFLVNFLRRFGAENHIAVADAAKRYGRLYRQGIPYIALMTNCANHPDKRGMKIFADALMAIFNAASAQDK